MEKIRSSIRVFYKKQSLVGLSSIVLILLAISSNLFLENQRLEKQLEEVTHDGSILDAEVPDAVLKYAPLLVGKDNPGIKELAKSLESPEKMFLFVRDEVKYSEDYDKMRTAAEVLESRKGDCLGQADLLASLLLAYGYTEEEVMVSMGYVDNNGERQHHAWVEFRDKGKWIVLDASRFMGKFEFDRWDRESFYQTFRAETYAQFNDGYVHVDLNGS